MTFPSSPPPADHDFITANDRHRLRLLLRNLGVTYTEGNVLAYASVEVVPPGARFDGPKDEVARVILTPADLATLKKILDGPDDADSHSD